MTRTSLHCFDRNYNERGDGGCSDQEGDVVSLHNDALEENCEEQVLRDEANNLDAEEEGLPSTRIPGAAGGWLSPAPPDIWGDGQINISGQARQIGQMEQYWR